MADNSKPIAIKKYANRRLYHTGTSSYVTLDDLAEMVKNGEDFIVTDAKTGEDITRSVLTQIIFEQESRGQNLLPITFLRQLIRFYGDSLENVLPSYLEMSLGAFTNDQDKWRDQMSKTFGGQALNALEEQTRANMALFENAMRIFSPFGETQAGGAPSSPPQAKPSSELDDLKRQVNEMQSRLNQMSKK